MVVAEEQARREVKGQDRGRRKQVGVDAGMQQREPGVVAVVADVEAMREAEAVEFAAEVEVLAEGVGIARTDPFGADLAVDFVGVGGQRAETQRAGDRGSKE
ncbi:MAG: hypothetical protein WDN30_08790 [Pararobbsia sp.]